MTDRLTILLLGASVLLGCKSGASSPPAMVVPPTAPTPATPVAPGPAGRWVYEARTAEMDLQEAKPRELVMTEATRRTVNGTTVIELTMTLDGEAMTQEMVEGFGGAPFTIFGSRLVLLVSSKVPEGAIWMLFGGEPGPDDVAVAEALEQAPTWPLAPSARLAKQPEDDEELFDVTVIYARKVGSWDSICNSYVHPSPDSGDFFLHEHCFAPGVGITSLFFESVWGSYQVTLQRPPASFTIAP